MTNHDDRPAIGYPPTWTETAECTQHPPHLWHSPQPTDQALAVLVCTTCPVLAECLRDYGHEPEGIIAGLTATERGRLLATPRLDARAAHGTRSRYVGSRRWPGCRCDACHAAHALYERTQRSKRRAAKLAGKSTSESTDDGKLNE